MDTINYKRVDNYLIPDFQDEKIPPLRKYGYMRLQYLQEQNQAKLTILFMRRELNSHLLSIQQEAEERYEQLMTDLLKAQPAPDKVSDPLAWVGHMNNLKHQAEEIICEDILYR